jgi:hypothetical protein
MPINLFPNQIAIKSKSTTNVSGGQVVTYAGGQANVPALVTDANARLKLIYQQRNIVISHVIYVTPKITVNTGDIVVFGVKSFFISGMTDPSGTGRIYELHCSELQPGQVIIEEAGGRE